MKRTSFFYVLKFNKLGKHFKKKFHQKDKKITNKGNYLKNWFKNKTESH